MNPQPISKPALWTGRTLSGLLVLFLAMDGAMKLAKPPQVVEASAKVGIGEGALVGLGVVLLACTALYAFRATAIFGAVLLTGYLGGAVATHVVTPGEPFTFVFPVLLGVMAWGGLSLRDARLRARLPFRDVPKKASIRREELSVAA